MYYVECNDNGYISPMYVLNIPGLQWYEIDDTEDLKYAENNIIL